MVTINLAYTSSINAGKPAPALTIPQVWAGLQRKTRAGHEFVPAIASTDVLEERVDEEKGVPVIVREVVFKEGNKRVREECYEYEMTKIDFYQPNGSIITNTISEGSRGASEGDLLLTYTFDWIHAEIDAKDTSKVAEQREVHRKTAQMAVEKSIETIRRMIVDGSLKA